MAARAGWGAVVISSRGGVTSKLYGPIAGEQEAGVGEIVAATMALRHCTPPICLVTDYQGLSEGIKMGKEACTRRKRFAAAWRDFWQAWEDVGEGPEGASCRWL